MKLRCKRRQHAQALVSSLSHLSLLHPLLSLSHAHTHAHTLGLPYKFLSDRVAVVSPCFPICFGCVRTSVLANAAVIIHGTNCVYYNIPLRLANKRTAVQTDSRTGRPAGRANLRLRRPAKAIVEFHFSHPAALWFALQKRVRSVSLWVCVPRGRGLPPLAAVIYHQVKKRAIVCRDLCVCGPTRHALISQASHKWSPPTHTHWLR